TTIKTLTFGKWFNQPITSSTFPTSLISLTFGESFNQPIPPGSLPSSITSLTFGYKFRQEVFVGSLPCSLTSLTFYGSYPMDKLVKAGGFPPSLIKLEGDICHTISPGSFPMSLQSLRINNTFNETLTTRILPPSLTSLTLGDAFNKPIDPGALGSTLTSLTFFCHFNQRIIPEMLPQSLQILEFGSWFNNIIDGGALPPSLTTLKFGSRFNRLLLPGVLPYSLINLSFDSNFNQPLNNALPSSLQTLTFGVSFRQSLVNILPPSITSITLYDSDGYSCEDFSSLPITLRSLTFTYQYRRIISPGTLPPALLSFNGLDSVQDITPGLLPATLTSLMLGPSTKLVDISDLHKLQYLTIPTLEQLQSFPSLHSLSITVDTRYRSVDDIPPSSLHMDSLTIYIPMNRSRQAIAFVKALTKLVPNVINYNVVVDRNGVYSYRKIDKNTGVVLHRHKVDDCSSFNTIMFQRLLDN
ncbi:hypothetical protein SAMD00019534_077420, partial [Acytostelium subglobosum LB1]|uniref:hypothetical protein n=1 Tax=Acytostelium subglobosum LB1 TaxID=1410327 RepID=UPI000645164E